LLIFALAHVEIVLPMNLLMLLIVAVHAYF